MKIKITVKGLVQGIGFRPFVAELAEELHIVGWVRNTAGVVTILAEAKQSVLEEFRDRLVCDCPPGGHVEELLVTKVADDGISADAGEFVAQTSFHILESDVADRGMPYVPADMATCPRCLKELHEEKNIRYRHPFISCVSCGPRYSIIRELPYDRDHITMSDFTMCPVCGREYREKGNIRRHAQTIACRYCGPRLHYEQILRDTPTEHKMAEPISLTDEESFCDGVALLRRGGILAVKDIGGYHIACRADLPDTVAALRLIKGREKKPFALMYADVKAAQTDCAVNEREAKELLSNPRPIVLCHKLDNPVHRIVQEVCGNSPDIGAMLPSNPLQTMLMEEFGDVPLIMTSANFSGEPMIITNERMVVWLNSAAGLLADTSVDLGIWSHEREILSPLDDSVVRVVCGRRQIVRRSRGFVPEPVRLRESLREGYSYLAMGGDLKATCAYGDKDRVVPSAQMGDLEDIACAKAYDRERDRLGKLLYREPNVIVTDLHPGYRSAMIGRKINAPHTIGIQHHMAHMASVVAEHQLTGEIIGVIMDGTGYGTDGTIWGGEIFWWKNRQTLPERIGHIPVTELPGGDAGAKNCESMAYAYLSRERNNINEAEWEDFWNCTGYLSRDKYALVEAAIHNHIHTVTSTSTGRLFDAVSGLLGICLRNDYEGEAAMELEYIAGRAIDSYPLTIEQLVPELVHALCNGVAKERLALGFIDALACFIYDEVVKISANTDAKQVVLAGGTFYNRLLTERVISRFEDAGYQVFLNECVPSGDGGICLGQIYLADCILQNEEEE